IFSCLNLLLRGNQVAKKLLICRLLLGTLQDSFADLFVSGLPRNFALLESRSTVSECLGEGMLRFTDVALHQVCPVAPVLRHPSSPCLLQRRLGLRAHHPCP